MSHLGYKDIERPVEAVGVEHLCTVLTDLLQGPEASLARGVVITSTRSSQQLSRDIEPLLTCLGGYTEQGAGRANCVVLLYLR